MARNATTSRAAWVLLVCVASHTASAEVCQPGHGLKSFDLLGFFGTKFGDGTPTCRPCGAWEASAGGEDAVCELCLPVISAPNSLHTACDCQPGTYVGESPANYTGVTKSCVPCGGTAISTDTNAASCTQCPEESVARNSRCTCPPGSKATGIGPNGVTGCEACADSEVSPGGVSTECTSCPDNTSTLSDRSYCGCLPSTRLNSSEPLTCLPCMSVFEYTNEPNRLMMCKQCSPFSYANKDHTGCECTGGYYAEDATAMPVTCKSCPPGTYKAKSGNDLADCIPCVEGLVPSGSGRQCVAPLCPPGTEPTADGICRPCQDGYYNNRRGQKCQPCKDNTWSSPDHTTCDVCVDGALQTSKSGQPLACMACHSGFSWNATSQSCYE